MSDLRYEEGCWFAGYSDHSGHAVFPDELSALRYAIEHHMDEVRLVKWGEDIRNA